MSPFTTGGYTATGVFDHTSTLLLLETLFGVPVPNVSDWRRSTVGDLTSALALGKPAQPTPPVLPDASLTVPVVDEEVVVNALTGTFDEGFAYPPPTQNVMPVQETTPATRRHRNDHAPSAPISRRSVLRRGPRWRRSGADRPAGRRLPEPPPPRPTRCPACSRATRASRSPSQSRRPAGADGRPRRIRAEAPKVCDTSVRGHGRPSGQGEDACAPKI